MVDAVCMTLALTIYLCFGFYTAAVWTWVEDKRKWWPLYLLSAVLMWWFFLLVEADTRYPIRREAIRILRENRRMDKEVQVAEEQVELVKRYTAHRQHLEALAEERRSIEEEGR